MKGTYGNLKLISGTSHPDLSNRIASSLGIPLIDLALGKFPDGEIHTVVKENVRGDDVFVLQSLHSRGPHSMIEEVEFLVDCLRDSAGRITGVIPWLGYSKQDRRTIPRESRSLKVIAKRLSQCGLNRVLLFDLHNSATAGFFDIPTDHVYLMRLLIERFKAMNIDGQVVIGSPDVGSSKRADAVSSLTGISDICLVRKITNHQTKTVDISKSQVLGDVKGKIVCFFDDLLQSSTTLTIAAEIVKDKGAEQVICFAVHPDFTPVVGDKSSAFDRINNSAIDRVIVVDTIPHDRNNGWSDKIEVIDPSSFIATCISSLHNDEPLSPHFLTY
ncbi:MAG: hypothetical protein COV55_01285 [Candidatus Komeilibacteria bacterium CG11_big_fil_rev_8_21_14_0_20_36_20]|uniref:ribose-phosphate diphosphokinase n=1 Tax=Candidatus Komeilibacteria bacterium CG11_big_fil_rev_8_21_14_0_20_36_20 TaxID=1974477 RepID=A0A2H0NDR5_9BACT|nr:MAG: hypothetical protein COV55_01285 [Candidatus Komeilibacteria bacterium CG11_big_fil_rev_8_21_14_0_20_36_20]PIR81413.1 MAG: hypothetical protein COU21_04255 [Candidatus Komeilibacteria bacterium CG10_big_fil_rev_8_21_14_0_10_36_65]PJC55139.1 MAG: hypothetical protein CO027_03210 [Candidatus Komeilibacteria bacterium CG_4_9_14_0_2_um_filter_36_13]